MKYAIVESGGKQYRAVEGAFLEVDRLPLAPGSSVKLEQVLLLADGEQVTVGKPHVKDNPVWTTVVEHFRGPKVVIFNYRPKKRIRVKTGHRQNYTRLLVEQIGGSALMPKKEAVQAEAEKPAKGGKAAAAAEKAEAKETKPAAAASKEKPKSAPAAKKPARQDKKPAAAPKGKAAPAKKPAEKKPAAKKPAGKSAAK